MTNISKRDQNKLDWYKRIVAHVEAKGGKVISDHYERMHAKMVFQCKERHEFSSRVHDVWNGSWCPECAGNKRLTVDRLQAVAASKGGRLVTPGYLGINVHHTWSCSAGHRFSRTPLNVIHFGAWCRECPKRR